MNDIILLHDPFDQEPLPHWTRYLVGESDMEVGPDGLRLVLDSAREAGYSDSQLDDFHQRPRADFLWKPPLRLSVRARFSHGQASLRGTAGFGWWNAPFKAGIATEVAVGPKVLWFFFGSAPSNLAATPGWEGQGWFAQGMTSPSLPGWIVRAGMAVMRFPLFRRAARMAAGSTSQAAEQPLPAVDITEWHEYQIEWYPEEVNFLVDERRVLKYHSPPAGPLALVLWMDNQWATIDGKGGLLDVPGRQWLELASVKVESLARRFP